MLGTWHGSFDFNVSEAYWSQAELLKLIGQCLFAQLGHTQSAVHQISVCHFQWFNGGPTSSSQKGADSHLARRPVYKPHVGPRSVVLSIFPAENTPNPLTKRGASLWSSSRATFESAPFVEMMRWGQLLNDFRFGRAFRALFHESNIGVLFAVWPVQGHGWSAPERLPLDKPLPALSELWFLKEVHDHETLTNRRTLCEEWFTRPGTWTAWYIGKEKLNNSWRRPPN